MKSHNFFECGDTVYKPISINENKLILEKKTRFGINYTDVKIETISRKITKEGYIRLHNKSLYVFDVPGVKFHYDEYTKRRNT